MPSIDELRELHDAYANDDCETRDVEITSGIDELKGRLQELQRAERLIVEAKTKHENEDGLFLAMPAEHQALFLCLEAAGADVWIEGYPAAVCWNIGVALLYFEHRWNSYERARLTRVEVGRDVVRVDVEQVVALLDLLKKAGGEP